MHYRIPVDAKLVKLPRAFFSDHEARGCPTPHVMRENRTGVWVSREDPFLAELISDARYYADGVGFDASVRHVVRAARALLAALK